MSFCARIHARFNITAKSKPTKLPKAPALAPTRTWPDAHNFTVKTLVGPEGRGTGKVQLRDEEGNVVLEVKDRDLHALVDAGQLTPKNWAKGLIKLAKDRGIIKSAQDPGQPSKPQPSKPQPSKPKGKQPGKQPGKPEAPEAPEAPDAPEDKPTAKRGGRQSNAPKPVGDVKPSVIKRPDTQPTFKTDQGEKPEKSEEPGEPEKSEEPGANTPVGHDAAPPPVSPAEDPITVLDRIEHLKGMNAVLLLIATQDKGGQISQTVAETFHKNSKDLRTNKKLIQVLLEPGDRKVRGIYGFIGEAGAITALAKQAEDVGGVAADQKRSLPKSLTKLKPEFFDREDPFTECPITSPFVKSMVPEIALVRGRLNEVWAKLKGDGTEEDSPSVISAMQFNITLPLNYMRFMDVKLATRRYYLAGIPERAGYPGMGYVLCTKAEADHFFKEMKAFKQPPLFYEDIRFLYDIDREFKNYGPRKFMPARALILMAKDKFERPHVDLLTRYAHEVLKAPSGASDHNPRYLLGNTHVNINRDATRAIVWCGASRVKVTLEQVIEQLPFVQGIDTRYL